MEVFITKAILIKNSIKMKRSNVNNYDEVPKQKTRTEFSDENDIREHHEHSTTSKENEYIQQLLREKAELNQNSNAVRLLEQGEY